MASQELLMLTRSKVARLAGVTERRLDYWNRTGLLNMTIEEGLVPSRPVRLLNFTEAMTAMVLAALREQVSLQHVRQIMDHLRSLEFEVTEVNFAIAGSRVHLQLPDGSWSGVDDPGQIEFHQVLHLEPLRAKVLGAGERAGDEHGQIERRRGRLGSKPVLKGTRVPVRAVQAYIEHGSSDAETLRAYPDLTRKDMAAVRALASA